MRVLVAGLAIAASALADGEMAKLSAKVRGTLKVGVGSGGTPVPKRPERPEAVAVVIRPAFVLIALLRAAVITESLTNATE